MSEMRTMATSSATATKPGAGGKGGEADEDAPKKGGKKKLLIIGVVVLLVVAGAAYWFLLKPKGHHEAKKEVKPAPVAGAVVTLDPISVNLADGHYLKIGIALQETKDVKEAVDGSKALDAVISIYSNQSMAQLADPAHRDEVKKQLVEKVEKLYDDEVYDVYLTSYVMQ